MPAHAVPGHQLIKEGLNLRFLGDLWHLKCTWICCLGQGFIQSSHRGSEAEPGVTRRGRPHFFFFNIMAFRNISVRNVIEMTSFSPFKRANI